MSAPAICEGVMTWSHGVLCWVSCLHCAHHCRQVRTYRCMPPVDSHSWQCSISIKQWNTCP